MDTLILAIGLAFAIGIFIYTDTHRRYSITRWFIWVFGLVCVVVLVHWLKRVIGRDASWKQRPSEAKQCDLLEKSSNDAGDYGFPSGHSAFAIFYVLGLWWLTRSLWVLIIGIPWAIYVGYTRVYKQCHTIPQILAGYCIGILCFGGLFSVL